VPFRGSYIPRFTADRIPQLLDRSEPLRQRHFVYFGCLKHDIKLLPGSRLGELWPAEHIAAKHTRRAVHQPRRSTEVILSTANALKGQPHTSLGQPSLARDAQGKPSPTPRLSFFPIRFGGLETRQTEWEKERACHSGSVTWGVAPGWYGLPRWGSVTRVFSSRSGLCRLCAFAVCISSSPSAANTSTRVWRK